MSANYCSVSMPRRLPLGQISARLLRCGQLCGCPFELKGCELALIVKVQLWVGTMELWTVTYQSRGRIAALIQAIILRFAPLYVPANDIVALFLPTFVGACRS